MPNIITERAEEDSDLVEERMLDRYERANGMSEEDIRDSKDAQFEEMMGGMEAKAMRGELDKVLPIRCHVSMASKRLHRNAGWPLRFHE